MKNIVHKLINDPVSVNLKRVKCLVSRRLIPNRIHEKRKIDLDNKRLEELRLKENNKHQKYEHPPIEVVNLNANDICNSKCVMCNIWEQKKGFEISPSDLEQILKDPLFKNVKNIGVTGGEPTLRKDLHLLYEAIIKAIPNIEGLSTITNAIREKDVIDRVNEVIGTCEKHDKKFSMMVSVDGYGEVHDKIRGKEGNFETAVNVIEYFRNKNINVTTGSTISKDNVWDMDGYLDFVKENNIDARFRVAEFIKRLYNENKATVIRNFDDDETYNLILFFYKLIHTYEKNESYIRTYESIINMLSGGKRLIGCPYQSNGTVLNSRGELAYCAPKSEIIGDTLEESALSLYNDNLAEKDRILNSECDDCIHDYHYPITYQELKLKLEQQYWKRFIKIKSSINFKKHSKIKAVKNGDFQVFITGWYGTETVGDKAILAGIVDSLNTQYNSNYNLVIASIYPIITLRTIKELHIEAEVIASYSKDFIAYTKGSDIVIMGGGPLMDLEELALPLYAFKLGKAVNAKTIIYGCGIGPLYDEKFEKAVKEILHISDEIILRDQQSIDIAEKWIPKKKISLSADPAKSYLLKIKNELAAPKRNVLKCYLREWTFEYNRFLTREEFKERKENLEIALSNFIKEKAKEVEVDGIEFEHMHNFVIGNDDRDFSRYFTKKYFKDSEIKVSFNNRLSTVNSIAINMLEAKHNICMRFHSVVFADTLDTSYTAFDYTNGGKVLNFLTDNNKLDHLLTVDDLLGKIAV